MTMTDISKIKRIAVLGAGESGVGAAILAMSRGIGVLVSDSGQIPRHTHITRHTL